VHQLWGCHYLVSEDDIERLILFIESNATQQTRTLITFNNENNAIEILSSFIPGTDTIRDETKFMLLVKLDVNLMQKT
jgi:hypothetical protein